MLDNFLIDEGEPSYNGDLVLQNDAVNPIDYAFKLLFDPVYGPKVTRGRWL